MGVSYETDPQNPLAWFREQLAALNRRFDALEGAGRTATGRSGQVNGSLTTNAGVTAGTNRLTRRNGIVTFNFRASIGSGYGGVIGQIPAGFRFPFADDLLFAGIRHDGTNWVTAGYYFQGSSFNLLPLTFSAASGQTVACHLQWPAA